jgi:hypothetical protein
MQLQLTPRRIALGGVLSLFLILQCLGNISGGKWSVTSGVLFGLLGIVLVWAAVFTARTPPPHIRRLSFPSFMLVFLFAIVFFLALFKVLDVFHVPWRQYWH